MAWTAACAGCSLGWGPTMSGIYDRSMLIMLTLMHIVPLMSWDFHYRMRNWYQSTFIWPFLWCCWYLLHFKSSPPQVQHFKLQIRWKITIVYLVNCRVIYRDRQTEAIRMIHVLGWMTRSAMICCWEDVRAWLAAVRRRLCRNCTVKNVKIFIINAYKLKKKSVSFSSAAKWVGVPLSIRIHYRLGIHVWMVYI